MATKIKRFFRKTNKLFKKSSLKVEINRNSKQVEDEASFQSLSGFIEAHKQFVVNPIESMSFEEMCFFGGFPVQIYTTETVLFENVRARKPTVPTNKEVIICSQAEATKDAILPFLSAEPEKNEYERVLELESTARGLTIQTHIDANALEISQQKPALSELASSIFNVSGNAMQKEIGNENVEPSLHASSVEALGTSSRDSLNCCSPYAFGISSNTSLTASLKFSSISIPSFMESAVFSEQNELANVDCINECDDSFERAIALHKEIEWKTKLFERTKDVFFLHKAQKLREKNAQLLKLFLL